MSRATERILGRAPVAAEQPEKLGSALNSAAIHFLRAVRKQDNASGVPPVQFSALSVLVFGGAMSAGRLAAAEGVKPPSLSPVLKALEAGGLISRRPDPLDARAVILSATQKGRRVMLAGRQRRVAAITRALGELNEGELKTLRCAAELLERLAHCL